MRRREFITLLGGAAAAWPLAAGAQQAGKLPTIGYLGSSTALHQSLWVAAFVQRLSQLGWIEHRNIAIDYRWAEARTERFAEIAARQIRDVTTAYKVYFAKTVPGIRTDPNFDHSSVVYLVGTDGRYIGFFPPGTPADRMVAVLRPQLAAFAQQ